MITFLISETVIFFFQICFAFHTKTFYHQTCFQGNCFNITSLPTWSQLQVVKSDPSPKEIQEYRENKVTDIYQSGNSCKQSPRLWDSSEPQRAQRKDETGSKDNQTKLQEHIKVSSKTNSEQHLLQASFHLICQLSWFKDKNMIVENWHP